MRLSKVRIGGAIFFEIISILVIVFYASPEFLDRYQSHKPQQAFYQTDFKNPIVFCKVFENLTYTHSLTKIQIANHPVWDIVVDVAALKVTVSKALLVVPYLHNVFYVFVSINAP